MYKVGRKTREGKNSKYEIVTESPEYYFGRIGKDGNQYFYITGSHAFEHLNGLTPACRGKLVDEVFMEKRVILIKEIYGQLSEAGGKFRYVREYKGNNSINYWDVSFELKNGQMCCVGTRRNRGDAAITELTLPACEQRSYGLDGSLMVFKEEQNYIVEDYSENLYHLLCKGKDICGQKVEDILSENMKKGLVNRIMDICLKDNMLFCYDIDLKDNPLLSHIKVMFVPLPYRKLQKIMVNFQYYMKMNEVYYGKLEQAENPSEYSPYKNKKEQLIATMTKREAEVADLVVAGETNKGISVELTISDGTVKKIIYNIYRKLKVGSRVELVKLFLEDDSEMLFHSLSEEFHC